MTKNEWRLHIKDKRKALSEKKRLLESHQLTTQILKDPRWQRADTILLYLSFGSEFDTMPLIHAAWAAKKTVAIPVCFPDFQLVPSLFTKDTILEQKSFGLSEIPRSLCEPIDVKSIDFCLIPGLAFDAYGNRLGYGAGYYDRFLPQLSPSCTLLAACFSCQLIGDQLPSEATDVHINEILTPSMHFFTQ